MLVSTEGVSFYLLYQVLTKLDFAVVLAENYTISVSIIDLPQPQAAYDPIGIVEFMTNCSVEGS